MATKGVFFMNILLREGFENILREIMNKPFLDNTKDELTEKGMLMLQLQNIAINYCNCERYEFLAILINSQDGLLKRPRLDVDKHNEYCKFLDIISQTNIDRDK